MATKQTQQVRLRYVPVKVVQQAKIQAVLAKKSLEDYLTEMIAQKMHNLYGAVTMDRRKKG